MQRRVFGVPARLAPLVQALAHGAAMINDIYALRRPGALDAVAQSDCALCLMHMQGIPESMQHNPEYSDVTTEVVQYLQSRVDECLQAGIAPERLLLDPGFGFGKTLQHNIDLMRDLKLWMDQSAYPVLIGVSRKTMLGQITGIDIPEERVVASVTAAIASIARGAHIVRVHDVKETVQAVKIWQELGVWA